MEKEIYKQPEMALTQIEKEDVIRTSPGNPDTDVDFPGNGINRTASWG